MKYSIYFPTIKYPELIKLTLESLLDQITVPFETCYLVNDAADHEVKTMTRKICQHGYKHYIADQFRLIEFSERRGPSKCLNAVIQRLGPQEDLLVITHALYPDTLIPSLQAVAYDHALSPCIGIVNCGEIQLLPDDRNQYLQTVYQWVQSGIKDEVLLYRIRQFCLQQDPDPLLALRQISSTELTGGVLGGTFYMKHQCFSTVGFFDEHLRFVGEDWDYQSRMTQAGLLTVFSRSLMCWPIARGVIYGRLTDQDFSDAQRRMTDKYHGSESERWKEIQGFSCRQLATKETHDYVLVGEQKLPMLHSIR
ncbi:glycosyltransferase [Candidatus Woesearchaeota archaeon]|nr:glycosyltransferase [Candidatus Woesearchaeota archaeon]